MKGRLFIPAVMSILVVGMGLVFGAVLNIGNVAWSITANRSGLFYLMIPLLTLYLFGSLVRRRR